MKRRLLILLPH
jgi:annexin A7/11